MKFIHLKIVFLSWFYLAIIFVLPSYAIGIWFDFPHNDEIKNGKAKYGVDLDKSLESVLLLFTKGPQSQIAKLRFSLDIENLRNDDAGKLVGREFENPLFKAVSYRLIDGVENTKQLYWFVMFHPKMALFLINPKVSKISCKLESGGNSLFVSGGVVKVDGKGEHILIYPIYFGSFGGVTKYDGNNPIVEFAVPEPSQNKIYGFLFFLSPLDLPKIYYSTSDFGLGLGLNINFDSPYRPSSMYSFFIPEYDYVASFNKGEFIVWGGFLYQSGEFGRFNRLAMFDTYTLTYKKSPIEWQLIFDSSFTGSIKFDRGFSNVGSGTIYGEIDENLRTLPIRLIMKKGNYYKKEYVLDVPTNQSYRLLESVSLTLRECKGSCNFL